MYRLLDTSRGVIVIRPAIPDNASQLRKLHLDALAAYSESFLADYSLAIIDSRDVWVERISEYIH